MSTQFFDYDARLKETVNFDGGFPGQKGAVSPVDVIVAAVASEDIEFGSPVEITFDDTNKCYKAALCKTVAKFGGIALEDVRGQRDRDNGYIYGYKKGDNVSVMRTGKLYVPVQSGIDSVAYGGSAYLRTAASSDGALIVGGIEGATATGNSELKALKFGGFTGHPVNSTNKAKTTTVNTSYTALVFCDLGIC